MGGDTLMTLNKRIERFNTERGLLDGDQPFNFSTEYDMLDEELEEFKYAYEQGDMAGMIDALDDIKVVATGTICKLGFDPDRTMDETLKEIEDRTGVINPVTGKWQKKLRGDEYKADYGKAMND